MDDLEREHHELRDEVLEGDDYELGGSVPLYEPLFASGSQPLLINSPAPYGSTDDIGVLSTNSSQRGNSNQSPASEMRAVAQEVLTPLLSRVNDHRRRQQQQPIVRRYKVAPEDRSGIGSLAFTFVSPLLRLGSERALDHKDMLLLPRSIRPQRLFERFWPVLQRTRTTAGRKWTFLSAIFRSYGARYMMLGRSAAVRSLAVVVVSLIIMISLS